MAQQLTMDMIEKLDDLVDHEGINSLSRDWSCSESSSEESVKSLEFNRTRTAFSFDRNTQDDPNTIFLEPQFGRKYFFEYLSRHIDRSDLKLLSEIRNGGRVIKCGWVWRRTPLVTNWKKRYFVLERAANWSNATLSYYSNQQEKTAKGIIQLGIHSRMVVGPHGSKPFEFHVLPSQNRMEPPNILAGENEYSLAKWIAAIDTVVYELNYRKYKESYFRTFQEYGRNAFLVRFGVRKLNARGSMQTRVIEFDLAYKVLHVTKLGETKSSFPVSAIVKAYSLEEKESVIEFEGALGEWHLHHDTLAARDAFIHLTNKLVYRELTEQDIQHHHLSLTFKTGMLKRKKVSKMTQNVGPHATIKGSFEATLHEYHLQLFPMDANRRGRPCYIFHLPDLPTSHDPNRKSLNIGRYEFVCESREACREWYFAIQAASMLSKVALGTELEKRIHIKKMHTNTVHRLRRLLYAGVTPEGQLPAKEQDTIQLMMKTLWVLYFPEEPWTGNMNENWLKLGFQRGGPASDLRSSGLLGLHCIIYYMCHHHDEFSAMLDAQQAVLDGGRKLQYPIAIACINVVMILVEMIGIGDTYSSDKSVHAPSTFARFVAHSTPLSKLHQSTFSWPTITRQMEDLHPEHLFAQYHERLCKDAINTVFEDLFCAIFPLLNRIYNQLEASYMEFGKVLEQLKRRLIIIFDKEHTTMDDIKIHLSSPFQINLNPSSDDQ